MLTINAIITRSSVVATKHRQEKKKKRHPINRRDWNLMSMSPWKTVIILIWLAVVLRLLFFIGWGLGDDPYYSTTTHNIIHYGYPDLEFGSNHRFGLFYPLVMFYKLFGESELTFALFPILSSVGQVVVIYLLGREFMDKKGALIAAFLAAISPFDLVFASTMTIDIPAVFLLSLSLYLLIRACKTKKDLVSYSLLFISSLLIAWAYLIKLSILFFVGVHFFYLLLDVKSWRRKFVFVFSLISTFGLIMVYDHMVSGDFLYYFHQEIKYSPQPTEFTFDSIVYLSWMFEKPFHQVRLFGFYFHAAIIVLLFKLRSMVKRLYLPIFWLISMYMVLEFFPGDYSLPYMVLPRFFRYTYLLLPPAILITASGINTLLNRKKGLLILTMCFLSISSFYWSNKIYRLYKDTQRDRKIAARMFQYLPRRDVYSDSWMLDTIAFISDYTRSFDIRYDIDGKWFQGRVVQERDLDLLDEIEDAYIIVGGSRGPDVGMFSVFNLKEYPVPENWELMIEIQGEINIFREETLKVYYVKADKSGNKKR